VSARITVTELEPAMELSASPVWIAATWVGMLDLPAVLGDMIELSGGAGYTNARFLVRSAMRPVAFVESAVRDGYVDGVALARDVARWNDASAADTGGLLALNDGPTPQVSVVICTRNRTASLRGAVESVLKSEYPDFDVIVVDNASSDDETRRYVTSLDDPRVRVVTESMPGLAVARNTGLREATGDIVAFTDDDVVVDRFWLRWIASAFDAGPSIGCVTGVVPSGELRTPTQSYFEQQVHWSSHLDRAVYDIERPPPGHPMFPFQIGLYGTGASFALRRSVAVATGGFDEALGAGSPTGGGEDIDMFVRVLMGGWRLVYEPAAIVWHRHRADVDALHSQAYGYGLGLGAWLGKVACDRKMLPAAARRALHAARHLRTLTRSPEVQGFEPPTTLRRSQLLGLVKGPLALAAARRQGRRPEPLAAMRASHV
jgi:glycosyltransferase involved in cell wall biosynthesis